MVLVFFIEYKSKVNRPEWLERVKATDLSISWDRLFDRHKNIILSRGIGIFV